MSNWWLSWEGISYITFIHCSVIRNLSSTVCYLAYRSLKEVSIPHLNVGLRSLSQAKSQYTGSSAVLQEKDALTHRLSFPSNKEGKENWWSYQIQVQKRIYIYTLLQSSSISERTRWRMEPEQSRPSRQASDLGSADADFFGGWVQAGAPNAHGIHQIPPSDPGSWSILMLHIPITPIYSVRPTLIRIAHHVVASKLHAQGSLIQTPMEGGGRTV